MRTTIKRYAALCIVLVLISAGAIMMMLDYETIEAAWLGLFGAVAFFSAGLWLGFWLDRKNYLPQ